jgi:transposase, IS30 family
MAIVVARDRDYRPTVGTLLECQTHYVLLVALPHGRTTKPGSDRARREDPDVACRAPPESHPWDQGKEMARYVQFTIETGVRVYFCDPHKPGQRGSNENTNGHLRGYFPKSADLFDPQPGASRCGCP